MIDCPSTEQLRAYLSDTLAEQLKEPLAQHIGQCTDCQRDLLELVEDTPTKLSTAAFFGLEVERHKDYRTSLLHRIKRGYTQARQAPAKVDLHTSLQYSGPIGEGGLGEVHAYKDAELGREVAVKLIRSSGIASTDARDRFARECRITGFLEHHGVAPVYGTGQTESGEPHYAMRYVKGKTLGQCIEEFHKTKAPLSRENEQFRALLGSFKTICETIGYAHERGIWHRDLKPQNVVVNEQGTVVLDWGIAKWAGETDGGRFHAAEVDRNIISTEQGAVVGTLPFMSPEQAAGALEAVDHKSDVYCLGSILFAILTSRAPHQFPARSPGDDGGTYRSKCLRQIIDQPTPLAGDANSSAPRELAAICAQAMKKEPSGRYGTATEIAADIERWLAGSYVHAYFYSRRDRVVRWLIKHMRRVAITSFALLTILSISNAAIQVSRNAERSQRLIAERQQELAEQRLDHVEVLRCQHANKLAQLAIHSGDHAAAAVALSKDVPPLEAASWDTSYLQQLISQRPRIQQSWAAGHWGFLDAALNSTGTVLATTDSSGSLLLWDVRTGHVINELNKGRFSAELRRPLHHFEGRQEDSPPIKWDSCPVSIAWLPQDKKLAAASYNGEALLYDTTNGKSSVLVAAKRPLTSVAVSGDGMQLLFGGAQGELLLCSIDGQVLQRDETARASVTDIFFCADWNVWCVVFENGAISLVKSESLEAIAQVELGETIWAADARVKDGELLIAVGHENGPASIIRGQREDNEIILGRPEVVKDDQASKNAIHAIRISNDGRRFYAINHDGLLLNWDIKSASKRWTLHVTGRDPRIPSEAPQRFQRRACTIIQTSDTSLLTAGQGGNLHFLKTQDEVRDASQKLSFSLGRSPAIAFSDTPTFLWALNNRGSLIACDVAGDKIIAKRPRAHRGGARGVAVLPSSGLLATVGGDRFVRFWKLEAAKIVAAPRQAIRAKEDLVSLAVSPDERWVAAVDVTSQLHVWNAETGRLLFTSILAEPGRPLTGRVAFNSTGTLLAAFGAGQSCEVYTCQPGRDAFRKLADQAPVAGNGGTAMHWNPVLPHNLITADTAWNGRVVDKSFGDFVRLPRSHLPWPSSTCRAIASTTDRLRVVLLCEEGAVFFCDSRYQLEMLRLDAGVENAVDLAFDPTGRFMVVAANAGELRLFDTGAIEASAGPSLKDETSKWIGSNILEETAAESRTLPAAIRLDDKDRVCLLVTEKVPEDEPRDGALYFVREHAGDVLREELRPGAAEFHRRMNYEAIALEITPSGTPIAFFRRRHAGLSPYDGSTHLATRVGRDNWQFEEVGPHGNRSFYPVVALDGEGVRTIFHFDFAGFGLHRWSPQGPDSGGEEPIGLQGDGFQMVGKQDESGRVHLLFDTLVFNNGPRQKIYMRWAPGETEPLRERVLDCASCIDLLPDGSPVLLRNDNDDHYFVRRGKNGWIKHQTAPHESNLSGTFFAIGPDGASYVVRWESSLQSIVLYRGMGEKWIGSVVAKIHDQREPSFATIRFDSRGMPVLIIGRLHEPFSWLKVFRKQ